MLADLDLHDLYQNQILQNMDNARFKLKFQLMQLSVDLQEVLVYLKEAQKSCNSWFGFIPAEDIQEVLSQANLAV